MKRIGRHLLFFTFSLSLFLVILYTLLPYKAQVVGVLLGVLVSCYNMLFLNRKIRKVGESASVSSSVKVRGTGMLHRFSIVALAIMVASRYPDVIDARTLFIGLPLCYFFVFLHQLVESRRELSLRKG